MATQKSPRLRTVDKVKPPYPLNGFPGNFAFLLGKEIVYLLATKPFPTLEGPEWEQIFAICVGAEWKPSNVGLDDVVLGICAWGAKSVKATKPFNTKLVRLISGRNSPTYSFNEMDLSREPDRIGSDVLKIWNARVEALRSKYSHLRTVVLIKSQDLSELVVFERETVFYPPDRYSWNRNDQGNLEGYELDANVHRFTWQPHGSQFTIIESVPRDSLLIRVRKPDPIDREVFLKTINYDESWVEIIKRPS